MFLAEVWLVRSPFIWNEDMLFMVVVLTTVKDTEKNLPRLLTISGNQINIKVFVIPENMKEVFSKFKAADNGSELLGTKCLA